MLTTCLPHFLCMMFYHCHLGGIISGYPNYSRTYRVVLHAQTKKINEVFLANTTCWSDCKQWSRSDSSAAEKKRKRNSVLFYCLLWPYETETGFFFFGVCYAPWMFTV